MWENWFWTPIGALHPRSLISDAVENEAGFGMFYQMNVHRPLLRPLLWINKPVDSTTSSVIILWNDGSRNYGLVSILCLITKTCCWVWNILFRFKHRSLMQSGSGLLAPNSGSLPPSQGSSIPYTSNGSWMDIWNDLSNECKEEVVVLDCEGILDLMEDYLKRHRSDNAIEPGSDPNRRIRLEPLMSIAQVLSYGETS